MTPSKDNAFQGKTIQSVERAFEIIKQIANEPNGLKLVDISERLSLHKSTVFHLTNTLVRCGAVSKDARSHRYTIGAKLFEYGQEFIQQSSINKIAIPAMEVLRNKFNETVHLSIIEKVGDRYEGYFIEKMESTNSMRMNSQVGKRLNFHATANGKVLLAFQPTDVTQMIMEQITLERFTQNTITDHERLANELGLIKERGWAMDEEEAEIGLCCFSAPIFKHDGSCRVAMSISVPSPRLNFNRQTSIINDLIDTTARISRELGWKPSTPANN